MNHREADGTCESAKQHGGLLQEVMSVLASTESKSMSPAAAVARLQGLKTSQPARFFEVMETCIDMVLSCNAPRTDAEDSSFDVIVGACARTHLPSGMSLLMHMLCTLVHKLGSNAGRRAPRNKFARCYGSRLLGRLLVALADDAGISWPKGVLQACENVLVRMSCDRIPTVRLAAVPGLFALQTEGSQLALVRLTMVDTTVAVRVAALNGVAGSNPCDASRVENMLLTRSLDVAPTVRRQIYAVMASARLDQERQDVPKTFVHILQRGLDDTNKTVRDASEEIIVSWLTQNHSCAPNLQSLLKFLRSLDVEVNTRLAEGIVNVLALRNEWQELLKRVCTEAPIGQEDFGSEHALVWRKMLTMSADGAFRCIVEFGMDLFIEKVECCLRRKDRFVLQQILFVLASAGSSVHGPFCSTSAGKCKLVEVAVLVLLHAPLQLDVEQDRPSTICLALVMIRNALKGCHCISASKTNSRHIDACFLDIANTLLSFLRCREVGETSFAKEYLSRMASSSEDLFERKNPELVSATTSFDELGERFDEILRNGNLHSEQLEELAWTSDCLSAATFRGLKIAEETLGLLTIRHGCDGLTQFEHLPEAWFRPTLMRADSCEGIECSSLRSWPTLRAVAVRCLALHSSLCPDLCASHWTFFMMVLKRCIPMVIASCKDDRVDTSSLSIMESCVHFLVDTMLLHHHVEDPGDLDARGREFFEAVAGLVGHPARQSKLPAKLWQCLTRLCMLFLFGGAWNTTAAEPLQNRFGNIAAAGKIDLDTIPFAARWVLTGLLVEAFYGAPPAAGSTGKTEQALEDSSQEASKRGCLLQFFSILSDISGMHATLLAAACEGVLSTELWCLGVRAQLGSGRQWRALKLPRLLRLLSWRLVVASGTGNARTATNIATMWLECIWRPLVLVCLDSGQKHAPSCQLLVEALLATLTAVDLAGELSGIAGWQSVLPEVAHSLSLIINSLVRRTRSPHKKGVEQASDSDADVNTVACAVASAEHGFDSSNAPLLKLADKLNRAAAEHLHIAAEGWEAVRKSAHDRRLRLRLAFVELGIDTTNVIAAARVRPSCTFLARARQRRMSSMLLKQPQQRHRCKISAQRSTAQRVSTRRKAWVSDDDSDAPPAQKHWEKSTDSNMGTPRRKRRRNSVVFE